MKPPALRSVIAVLSILGGLVTVNGLLFLEVQPGIRDAAVPLVVLILTQSGNVIRSLFREPSSASTERHDAKGGEG